MKAYRPAVAALTAVIAAGAWIVVSAGQQPPAQPLQLAPLGVIGEAVYPAVEGWGPTKDGTTVLLLGYFNRNKDQDLDIPIGPNNRIEPGGPDMGQPTHFHLGGRQYGVFAIPVPKDFGNKKLTWTIVANGQTSSVTLWQNPLYFIDFYKHGASGNEPPVIKFAESGPTLTGPPRGIAQTLYGTVGNPVELKFWAADQKETYDPEEGLPASARAARGRGADAGRGAAPRDDTPVAIIGTNVITRGSANTPGGGGGAGRGGAPTADIRITWHKYRGPGEFTWDTDEIRLMNKGDAKLFLEAKTNGYFSEPGEYWVRAQVNDESGVGGGGDQCCWTTALVKVIIK